MAIKHECEKCGYEIKQDVCYCEDCKDEAAHKAYDEGYADAKKEFEVKEK